MTWNYRLMRSRTRLPDGSFDEMLAMHEVFYDKSGAINGWTGPIYPRGDTWEDFQKELALYTTDAHCRKSQVLNEWQLPGYSETGAPTTTTHEIVRASRPTNEGKP